MKKRTYHITPKRTRLISEALTTVRETRETIDPGLLEQVRQAIGNAAETTQKERYTTIKAERVPVDHKKNLTIVMKYLELRPENKALQQEIRTFLGQH